MSQSSVKSRQSVNSTILTPTLDEVFDDIIEPTMRSQPINVRAENIELDDDKMQDFTLESFSLRNLGTSFSDLSLHDNIANLIESITDQKVETDRKLITKSSKEDDICTESQLTNEYFLSTEPLKIYAGDPEISNESTDKLSESIESSNKFTPIDGVELTRSPTIKLKRKKRFSASLSRPQNMQTCYDEPPITVTTSQSEKFSDDEVSCKRSKCDFDMLTSQLPVENSKEPMKRLKRMRSEDNVLVNLSNSAFTHKQCSSYNTQPCISNILLQQSKPVCEISTSLFKAISALELTDIAATIDQPEILTNTCQQFLNTNQSTDTVDQCVRNTVAEVQINSEKLSLAENVCGVSDNKSLHEVGNSQQITVDENNLMIEDTDTVDLAMSGKCATNAEGHRSPLFMYSKRTKGLPNNKIIYEKNTSESCDDNEPKQFSMTQLIGSATNTKFYADKLQIRNSTNISDGETGTAKDIVPDEKEITSSPFEFDLTTITRENPTGTVIGLTDIVPAADTTLQKVSKMVTEDTEFNLPFLTESQLMQIETDVQKTAEKSMDLSEPSDGKGTNSNELADWDVGSQFPTESQLDTIENEVQMIGAKVHDLMTDAANPFSEQSIDNQQNTAFDGENVEYSILTAAQLQNINRQINLTNTNMERLRRAVLQNYNNDINVFFKSDIKDDMMNIIGNTLSLPNWVDTPVLEPDYEKIKQVVKTRRDQIKKMLDEIRRLSIIVSNIKDIPVIEQLNDNSDQTPQQRSPDPQPVNEFYTTEKNSTNPCTNLQTSTNQHQLQNIIASTSRTPVAESSNTYNTANLNKTKFHTSSIFNQESNSTPLKNVPNIRKEYSDLVTSCKIPNIFGTLKYHANDKMNEPLQDTAVWFSPDEIEKPNVVNENNYRSQVQIPSTSTCTFSNKTNVISNHNAGTYTSNNTIDSNSVNKIFYSSDKK